MRMSIIVNHFNPTQNARLFAMTEFCLRTIIANTSLSNEILLVDGSGFESKKLLQICEEERCAYLPSKTRESFSESYNRGLRTGQGDYLVFLANDIFVCAGWDLRLIQELERTGAWMAMPFLSYSDYQAQIRSWVSSNSTFEPNFATFNLNMIRKDIYEAVGPIDDGFSGNFNDLDYYARIRKKGGTVIIADAGEIVHHGRATLKIHSDTNWKRDRDRFIELYPELGIGRTFDGNEALFGRSRVYRTILSASAKTAGLWPIRKLTRHVTRFEPWFHRI
jgi:GT2 family glycosyltransferase